MAFPKTGYEQPAKGSPRRWPRVIAVNPAVAMQREATLDICHPPEIVTGVTVGLLEVDEMYRAGDVRRLG